MNSPEEEWKTAMYEEYEAHIANGACDIVDSGSIFKTELDSNGEILL